MKKLFLLVLLLTFLPVITHAISIESEPFEFTVSLKNISSNIVLTSKVKLTCMGIDRCLFPGDCGFKEIGKKLSVSTTLVEVGEEYSEYNISYNGNDKLKNTLSWLNYTNRECGFKLVLTVTDHSIIGENDKKIVAGLIYRGNDFQDIRYLDGNSYNPVYLWERFEMGEKCHYEHPLLCKKFFYLIPEINSNVLNGSAFSMSTKDYFPKDSI